MRASDLLDVTEWPAILLVGFCLGVLGSQVTELSGDTWAAALGGLATFLAVLVAVRQIAVTRADAASTEYRAAAVQFLSRSIDEFAAAKDIAGRPINDRAHWLKLARAIESARALASRITRAEQREVWALEEHALRLRLADIVQPKTLTDPLGLQGFEATYFGPVPASDATPSTEIASALVGLAESSLVVVYQWIKWPDDFPDPITRDRQFTDAQLAIMESFGPRGVAEYCKGWRDYRVASTQRRDSTQP